VRTETRVFIFKHGNRALSWESVLLALLREEIRCKSYSFLKQGVLLRPWTQSSVGETGSIIIPMLGQGHSPAVPTGVQTWVRGRLDRLFSRACCHRTGGDGFELKE